MNEIVDNIVPIDDKVDKKDGASDQFPIWIFNFWPYGPLRAVRRKIQL